MTCNPDGYVIDDVILFSLEGNRVLVIGRPVVANWVQFNAETGGFNVRVERDERSLSNSKPRKTGAEVKAAILDYYLTPWDLHYGRLTRFDHDFVGRAALERMDSGHHRRKVTLVWNPNEVLPAQGSAYGNELPGEIHQSLAVFKTRSQRLPAAAEPSVARIVPMVLNHFSRSVGAP